MFKQYRKLSRLIPELEEWFHIRYGILLFVSRHPETGRRALTRVLERPERQIRNEISVLEHLGLIEVRPRGLILTDLGIQFISELEEIYRKDSVFHDLEKDLARRLGIRHIYIMRDKDDKRLSLTPLAETIIKRFSEHVSVLGVTGGTGVKEFIDSLPEMKLEGLRVVAARGSLGRQTALQANTLAEALAAKLKASHIPLFAIDQVMPDTLERMKEEPLIKDALEEIECIDALLFGIGRADVMLDRRHMSEEFRAKILEKGAVAEAIGCYFDKQGNIVAELNTIGIGMKHFQSLTELVGIAFGRQKAESLLAIAKLNPNMSVIIDPALAEGMLDILGGMND